MRRDMWRRERFINLVVGGVLLFAAGGYLAREDLFDMGITLMLGGVALLSVLSEPREINRPAREGETT